jgi:hypothetical protein
MRDYGRGNQQKSGLSPQAEAYTPPSTAKLIASKLAIFNLGGLATEAEKLLLPPHRRKVDVSARFSRSGVEVAEIVSEVRFFVWETE